MLAAAVAAGTSIAAQWVSMPSVAQLALMVCAASATGMSVWSAKMHDPVKKNDLLVTILSLKNEMN